MSARSRSAPWYRIAGERYARELAGLRETEIEASRLRLFRCASWQKLAPVYFGVRYLNVEGEREFYDHLAAVRRSFLEAIERNSRALTWSGGWWSNR